MAFAEVAQAVHYVEVGTGGVEHAGKDGHLDGGFPSLEREIGSGRGIERSKIAIEFLARKGQFFEADGVEQRQGTRGFADDLPQVRLVQPRLPQIRLK